MQGKTGIHDPVAYHAWYSTPRGSRIAGQELELMLKLLPFQPGEKLLDVGCGTGYFSSRFTDAGLTVTGLDPDPAALGFARKLDQRIGHIQGHSGALPFTDGAFDHSAAVTSLCFVADPARALEELWRVSRKSVILGLLYRRSLLWLYKAGRGSYQGARWDLLDEVRQWTQGLQPTPEIRAGWTVFFPSGGAIAQRLDRFIPDSLPLGGFLVVCLYRRSGF
jgi:SAM-dependent methyltransferase